MKTIKRIVAWLSPKFTLTYRKLNGEVGKYKIRKLDYYNYFGNLKENWPNVGVRAYCYQRKGIRSFRYEGILSIDS